MAKNIVICCDGTGNEYGDTNTNVVKFFRAVVRDGVNQVAYYDPGVGTLSAPGLISKPAKAISKAMGLAFGIGLTGHIQDAYRYLMERYVLGDQVFLFGFSRGAYTVRALASLLHVCGLLERGSENLIPYASQLLKNFSKETAHICEGFKETYSRACRTHFAGVWDTVSSVGWIYDPLKLAFTYHNPDIAVVRHALAIDERRCFFRQNLFGAPSTSQDVKQVWFAGVHSDIGGGYPEKESGLSKITLEWMAREAMASGLLIDQHELDTVLGKTPAATMESFARPDPTAKEHQSLHGGWWIAEFLPKRYMDMALTPPERRWKIPAGRRRFIAENSVLHTSVVDRLCATTTGKAARSTTTDASRGPGALMAS
jgi:uncharacterized protein (DUF2235 family)